MFIGFGTVSAYGSSVVTNDIDISVSTGNNSGSAHIGNGRADIFIQTKVDGEIVELIEKHVTAEPGTSINIVESTTYKGLPEEVHEEGFESIDFEDIDSIEESNIQVDTITNSFKEISFTNYNVEEKQPIVFTIFQELLLLTFFQYATSFFTIIGA